VRLLILEDNEVNREGLAYLLRLEGHEVEAYGTAEDVFRRLSDGRPAADAAVIDLKLPGSDGTTVARVMRTVSAWRNVPVVLTSGAVEELPGDSPYGGPTVSLRKQFDLTDLFEAIDRASKMQVGR
jgi:CheY-like chemotaxis protein